MSAVDGNLDVARDSRQLCAHSSQEDDSHHQVFSALLSKVSGFTSQLFKRSNLAVSVT